MNNNELLEGCLEQLEGVPFIKGVRRLLTEAAPDERRHVGPRRRADALLELLLVDGTTRRGIVEIKRTNLTTALVHGVRAQLADHGEDLPFLMAPYITPGIGALLVELGLNYVDAAGNRYVNVDDRYTALIEGRKPVRTTEEHGLRAAAYQVIFVLLARGPEIDATMRDLAADADVALGTVKNTLDHLQAAGVLAKTRRGYVVRDREHLIDRWLHGYETVVRPRWLIGRYTTQTRDLTGFETVVQTAMQGEKDVDWGWGGGAAAYALTKHYRGPEIVLHVTGRVPDLPRRLRALPDENGNLVLLRTPPGTFLDGEAPHTAHPLLVYAELRARHDERADETADLIKATYIDG